MSDASARSADLPRPGMALLVLIGVATTVRLVFAWLTGLGVDESYMVSAGRVLGGGYFDHPPASWWLSRGAALVLGTEAPLAVRLPFILLSALSTLLMYRLATRLYGPRAGFYAALAFTLAPMLGVTAGIFVLPDGPLLCALLCAALALLRALEAGRGRALGWWLLAGLCAGLALESKYTAILFLAGTFLFLILSPAHRFWLARVEPWLAALLALAIFAPVIAWNAEHGWASFAFQGGRAGNAWFRPWAPLLTWAGEAVFMTPWLWLPLVWCVWQALRNRRGDWRYLLPLCLGLPGVLAFVLISPFSRNVLFHWSACGYVLLLPLLGEAWACWMAAGNRHVRHTLQFAAGFCVVALLLLGTDARFGWSERLGIPGLREAWAADLRDWSELAPSLAEQGMLDRKDTAVAALLWHVAGKAAYGLGPEHRVVCLCADARQFGIAAPVAAWTGKDLVVLAPAKSPEGTEATIAPLFASVERLKPVAIKGQGGRAVMMSAWLGKTYSGRLASEQGRFGGGHPREAAASGVSGGGELSGRVVVVQQVIEQVLHEIRTAIAEVDVIGVFPHIDRQKHRAVIGGERAAGIAGLGDFQLAGRIEHQPGPAGAELAGGGGLELFLEGGDRAEILSDLLLQRTWQLAAGGRQAQPVHVVVPYLAGIVEHRHQGVIARGELDDLFERLARQIGILLNETVERDHVAIVVLAVMIFEGFETLALGGKGLECIGKRLQQT